MFEWQCTCVVVVTLASLLLLLLLLLLLHCPCSPGVLNPAARLFAKYICGTGNNPRMKEAGGAAAADGAPRADRHRPR